MFHVMLPGVCHGGDEHLIHLYGFWGERKFLYTKKSIVIQNLI